jgi:hypothetical protein
MKTYTHEFKVTATSTSKSEEKAFRQVVDALDFAADNYKNWTAVIATVNREGASVPPHNHEGGNHVPGDTAPQDQT